MNRAHPLHPPREGDPDCAVMRPLGLRVALQWDLTAPPPSPRLNQLLLRLMKCSADNGHFR